MSKMSKHTHESDLRNAFVLLKCTKSEHKDCRLIRDTLMKQSKNVLKAYTTRTKLDGVEYCVAGKAVMKSADVAKFKNDLWKIKTDTTKPIGVRELRVLVSTH